MTDHTTDGFGRLSDRVARVEGRVSVLENRQDRSTGDIIRVEKTVEELSAKMTEVNNFLQQATGAFKGLRIAAYIMSALIALGILTITVG